MMEDWGFDCVSISIMLMGLLLIVIMSRVLFLPKRCPKCGKSKGKEVSASKIPGTEREVRVAAVYLFGYLTDRHAKYVVYYRCQACGQMWSKEKRRRVK